MKSKKNIWDEVEIVSAIFASSETIKAILVALELPLNTTNYRAVHRFADAHNLSVPVMSGEAKGRAIKRSKEKFRPLDEEIFVERSPYDRGMVKTRLLASGVLEYKCYGEVCQAAQVSINSWEGIVLQLEHKNGIGDDNRVENLELLCPNCHSVTSTFGARNKVQYENKAHGVCKKCSRPSKYNICPLCLPSKRKLSSVSIEALLDDISLRGVEEVAKHYELSVGGLHQALRQRQDKINRIIPKADTKFHKEIDYGDEQELANRVRESSMVAVAKSLGVSDRGLKKHLTKTLGLDHPLFKKN